MFTGIVEETGRVVRFAPGAAAWQLQIAAELVPTGVTVGESVAVNGCCLTLTRHDAGNLWFDVLEETRRLTNFNELQPGASVNLERSLRYGSRVGGHFVTGHIDAPGLVEILEPRGNDHYLRVRAPEEFNRYLVYKGSLAVDGISLTVAEVDGGAISLWLIPHTMAVTNLSGKSAGQHVNLEYDLLAKYLERQMTGLAKH